MRVIRLSWKCKEKRRWKREGRRGGVRVEANEIFRFLCCLRYQHQQHTTIWNEFMCSGYIALCWNSNIETNGYWMGEFYEAERERRFRYGLSPFKACSSHVIINRIRYSRILYSANMPAYRFIKTNGIDEIDVVFHMLGKHFVRTLKLIRRN